MANFYLKVPFNNAQVTGLNTYCTGGAHPTVNSFVVGKNPRDLAVAPNTSILANFIGPVGSIRTTRCDDCICVFDPGYPWDTGVRVEFFYSPNGQDKIGEVLYAHVADPKANGTYNQSLVIPGKVAPCCDPCCTDPQNCAGCYTCFTGPHVHIEQHNVAYADVADFTCYQYYDTSKNLYMWENIPVP